MKQQNNAPRAIGPRRTQQIMIHTTEDVKGRLQKIADEHGWSLSKTGHLALEEWLEGRYEDQSRL